MLRSSKQKQGHSDLVAIAKILNGGTEGLLFESGGAIRVNGTKQVVVNLIDALDFRPGRLPAHASDELEQLAKRGLEGWGDIVEVRVSVDGRDRAGWCAGNKYVIYHYPVVQS